MVIGFTSATLKVQFAPNELRGWTVEMDGELLNHGFWADPRSIRLLEPEKRELSREEKLEVMMATDMYANPDFKIEY